MSLLLAQAFVSSIHLLNKNLRFHSTFPKVSITTFRGLSRTRGTAGSEDTYESPDSGDMLVQGLNGAQDISVKVVSCREIVQEAILRNDLSPVSGQALGEVITCSLMMGASLKGDETLQVNMVGSTGLRHVTAITDGELKVRGMVGESQFNMGAPADNIKIKELLGEGQVQVIRNHPDWKSPMNGITALRDTSIPLNLALYMGESEQRPTALLADVKVQGGLCRYALGVMVERLPGATEDNIETSISNLGAVDTRGLRSYLDRTDEERQEGGMFRNFEDSLHRILDDCLVSMDKDSIRWSKAPTFRCSCGIEKVWRTLRLLPLEEVQSIVDSQETVEMKCEFCGTKYSLTGDEIKNTLLV